MMVSQILVKLLVAFDDDPDRFKEEWGNLEEPVKDLVAGLMAYFSVAAIKEATTADGASFEDGLGAILDIGIEQNNKRRDE